MNKILRNSFRLVFTFVDIIFGGKFEFRVKNKQFSKQNQNKKQKNFDSLLRFYKYIHQSLFN